MAYADQDRSREKMVSGAISIAVVGVVGFGLASGLALKIIHPPLKDPIIHQWRHIDPVVPEPHPIPQPQHKTANPRPVIKPATPSHIVIIEPKIVIGGSEKVIDTGKTGPVIDLPPPQPTAVDHSSGASPKGRPGDWVSSEDYPASAVRAGIEGRTGFRLDVNADGRPTACTIVSSSGSAQLDRAACSKLIAKARFTPAHDAAGNAVASSYSNGVNWKLPATE